MVGDNLSPVAVGIGSICWQTKLNQLSLEIISEKKRLELTITSWIFFPYYSQSVRVFFILM